MGRAMARVGGMVSFTETGPVYPGQHVFDTAQMVDRVGDIVLARRDIGTSYHLAVVVDDAAQGVTWSPAAPISLRRRRSMWCCNGFSTCRCRSITITG
jgi:hypothetical protein